MQKNNTTNTKQKKELAKQIFLKDSLSQKEIAELVGCSEVSISRWVNKEKWDTEKVAFTITKEQQVKRLYGHIAAINEQISQRERGEKYPNSKEADTLNKLATAIRKLENETGMGEVISVCTKVCNFLRHKGEVEQAKGVAEVFNAFIKEVLC